MRLRLKVLMMLVGIWVIASFVIYTYSTYSLINHYQQSEIQHTRMSFTSLPLPSLNATLPLTTKKLNHQTAYLMTPSNSLLSYALIDNSDDQPIGILQLQTPILYHEGIEAIEHYITVVMGASVLFLVLIWYLLKKFVLDRIINLSQQVVQISTEGKFSRRLSVNGKDELESMINAINSLMEIIELSQEQLKYRIFQRTEELGRLSMLNRNLHSEMERQRETETKLREGEKNLRQMAYYDTLTGLPNRIFFNEILQKMITQSERDGSSIAILFIDADKLKSINDNYGHDMGDKFLIHTANQLKCSIKSSDFAARLAGDEFIVCLNNINKSKSLITPVAKRILEAISMPLKLSPIEIKSTFSIGISIYPDDGTTIESLEKHADLAMYYAKKKTGNIYYYYDEIEKHSESEGLS